MTLTFQVQPRRSAAFTLVEVVLAIIIALGILVVVLYFYQQATNLRAQAIQETERIAAIRLLMDRITGELRTAQAQSAFGQGFVGGSNSIQFVKADVPSFSSWTGGPLGRSALPVTDLKVVKYQLDIPDGTNVAGLVRSEEPLLPTRASLSNEVALTLDTATTTNTLTSALRPPALEEIRFLQFRYWSGTNWLDVWNSTGAPDAVEISVGPEPVTNSTDLVEYPADLFRRVIYMAGKTVASTGTASAKSQSATDGGSDASPPGPEEAP